MTKPIEAAAKALVEAQLGHPTDGHMKPEIWQKRLPTAKVAVVAFLEAIEAEDASTVWIDGEVRRHSTITGSIPVRA